MTTRRLRNIGISAHIDSGKTTLSERILFYAGRIYRIGEVRGDGAGATMDHMDLERERGITITCAATSVDWNDARINLIDTPGHVDFTVEVERSLRVLDGAVLVLCAVGGVQAQSITIDRQMERYNVPRLAFINKMDRVGADPLEVVRQLHDKLACDAVLMQIPIGSEADFRGVVDLIRQEAIYFEGDRGEEVVRDVIPEKLREEASTRRRQMLESLSMYSDELLECLLAEEPVDEALIHRVVKMAVTGQQITPVFLGTAYRNCGVQPLLDAVVDYLPSPEECEISMTSQDDPDENISLRPVPDAPMVAMAFKIVDDSYGTLTFMRIYQGRIEKGASYFNQRNGRKERFGRIVRMHADQREDVDSAQAGDIVAVLGAESASGDTYGSSYPMGTLESIHIPEPVIEIAVAPARRDGAERLSKALYRFRREDPTLHVHTDEESGETILAGMGELHLDVYIERIRREYGVAIDVGRPKVNYREAPTRSATFNIRHRKQTGGSGQYAHIVGRLEVLPDDADETFLFTDEVRGGRVPKQYMPAIEKSLRRSIEKGPLAGFPIVHLHVIITDGSYHEVDSSDMAFQICARTMLRETFPKTAPALLEPVMSIEVQCSADAQGSVVGDLTGRRGTIRGTDVTPSSVNVLGEVPLSEVFGYATDLRSMTQGQGTFTLEFSRYVPLPAAIQREVVAGRKGVLAGVV